VLVVLLREEVASKVGERRHSPLILELAGASGRCTRVGGS